MPTMNARIFFKEQEKRMNFSDDDMDDSYVARMTGENEQYVSTSSLDAFMFICYRFSAPQVRRNSTMAILRMFHTHLKQGFILLF